MSQYLNKKRIVILSAFIIFFLAILLFFLVLRFQTIVVVGNEKYTEDEIVNLIFERDYDRSVGGFFVKSLFKKKEIPFVETYEVNIMSFSKVKITVYEKSIIGYLEYMGNKMYFDKDGIVVESSEELIEGIPAITGLSYDYVVLHDKLPVEDDKVFQEILDTTQMIKKYEMKVEKIHISKSMELSLHIGNIRVELGKDDHLSEKMADLNDIIPKLPKEKGTLDMRVYDSEGHYTLRKN